MNADKIKVTLARLHLHEAGNGGDRVKAYKMSLVGSELTSEERKVLRDAVHIDASEVDEIDL
jgi:hypothetical protein